MIFRKLTATFGCLEGRSLELHEGLNVIEAPNEWGKSSWCAFLRAMLYGVDSAERARAGHLPDKTRYAPWSGAPMAGELELTAGGRDITLRRATRSANAPMREFSAVYTGTGEPVPGLDGAGAGEALCGVSREVFRRSAFIGQGEVAVTGAAELERRIAAVVSTGEEGTSYSEADERLRAWQRKRRHNRHGAIPALEAEAEGQAAALSRLEDAVRARAGAEAELAAGEARLAELDERLARSREAARARALAETENARAAARQAEAALDAAAREAARLREQTQAGPFAGLAPEAAAAAAAELAGRAEALGAAAAKRPSRLPVLLLLLLAAACLALGVFWLGWAGYAMAALSALGAAWAQLRAERAKNAAIRAGEDRARLLAPFGAADEGGVLAAAGAQAAAWEAWQRAGEAETRAREAAEGAARRRQAAETALLGDTEDPESARLARERLAVAGGNARLRAHIAELGGVISAVGDPMAIESGLLETRARIAELEGQYAALALAVETLKAADTEIQGRFSPALGRAAAAYLSRLTGGRYEELSVARDFSVMARLRGETLPRPALYMSAGAADLTYLAVRLAIVDLTLPAADPCPLVLDDALANLDPDRRARALALLADLAQTRQIILFTCG